MKQEKRVMIFCPDITERQQIKWFLEGYFKERFPEYASGIAMQEFDSIYQPKGLLTVGSLDEKELLYVIDKHAVPKNLIMTEKEIQDAKAEYDKWRRASYEESLKLLNEKQIPYIFHEDEFAEIRGKMRVTIYDRKILEKQFAAKLESKAKGESILEKMLRRLKMTA